MNSNLIFLPVIAQILLTMLVFIGLAFAKSKAVKSGEVNEERRALYDDAWPESVIKFNNNIRNQFELPVLFYAICFILWAIDSTNTIVHVLAWLFVVSRFIHVAIHTGANFVPLRRKVFMFGFFILVALVFSGFFSIAMKNFA